VNPFTKALRSFGVIGGIGFLVDAAALASLTHVAHWSAGQARLLSFPIAVTVTWALNRRYTFREQAMQRGSTELLGYFAIQFMGAAINVIVFALCLIEVPTLKSAPLVPLALGALIAFAFNFYVTHSFYSRGQFSQR
jgi:putative flippase GtrA